MREEVMRGDGGRSVIFRTPAFDTQRKKGEGEPRTQMLFKNNQRRGKGGGGDGSGQDGVNKKKKKKGGGNYDQRRAKGR